jgi:hypothetical protein
MSDLQAGRLEISGDNYLAITPSFITSYAESSYPSSLIYIAACHSKTNDTLARAFLENNASTYIGWDGEVNNPFANQIGRALFDYLIDGQMSIEEAFANLDALDGTIDGKVIDPNPPYAQLLFLLSSEECADIAGNWNFSESGTVTCTIGGETETETVSGTGTYTIEQNGCNISWEVPGFDAPRTGTIEGKNIQVSGKFVVAEGASFTQNTLTAQGTLSEDNNTINLNSSGIATGTIEGMSFSCTGTSTVVLTRTSSPSKLKTMDEQEAIREPSLLFLNNSLRIFTIISP